MRWIALAITSAFLLPALAQERIYRCGNEYTNNAVVAKSRGCKVMEGGNITIVQGTVPQAGASPRTGTAPTAPRSTPRNDSAEQRARDSDARLILESELRKAEDRLAQAQKAYANGQPEKEGIESRNHQRYLDRVAELKAAVARAESDVNGLRRELGRMGGVPPAGSGAAASGTPGGPESAAK
ncbi:hypothetical protein [Hydrogenophaga sp. A37]|uniref:hypothetical protein n=1 Tax=Hydrogenophaga sp. A37 TaxID=1945864 RepID=UPI00117BB61F|nr:hypothetical protein [Hydrogenophaga sp. A37]